MTTDEGDARKVLDKATEAVRDAAVAVQATSESIVHAINERHRSDGVFARLCSRSRSLWCWTHLGPKDSAVKKPACHRRIRSSARIAMMAT